MKIIFLSLALILSARAVLAADPYLDLQWGLANHGQIIYRETSKINRDEIVGIEGVDSGWPGLEKINALPKDREVVVAVIDSGVDLSHPDLKGRLYSGKDFLDDGAMSDDMGHGTHVAGIIAANTDSIGIQGLTPSSVKILPLKVLSTTVDNFVYSSRKLGTTRVITDIIADAIGYAIQAKVAVINMSLGWPQMINTPKIVAALDAAEKAGIIVVAASGNNNKDVPVWPCAHATSICVGAMDNQGLLTEFSNHGGKVDLVAPGEWIVSTIPKNIESRTLRINGYEAKNGSSQAAPFVTAAIALLKLQNPAITLQEIKARLYASATPVKGDREKRFVRFGALSIKGALDIRPTPVASVLVKDLITVQTSDNGDYEFSLPIEVVPSSDAPVSVTMEGLDANYTVADGALKVKGKLKDVNADSEVPVTFRTTVAGKTYTTRTTLSFATSVDANELKPIKVLGIPPSALMTILVNAKFPKVAQVFVESKPSSDFHGYVFTQADKTTKITTIRANYEGKTTSSTSVTIEDQDNILAVFEKDVNFDGANDLVFYGMVGRTTKGSDGKDETTYHFILTFTDMKGKPLYGDKSRWELPFDYTRADYDGILKSFEGLPMKDGAKVDFTWLRMKTMVGDVAVPYYEKPWYLPDQDNATTLLDYVNPISTSDHLYYWEPYQLDGKRVLVRPRVIDSVAFMKELKKKLKPSAWEDISIEHMFLQSETERVTGSVRHLVSVGNGLARRFFVMKVGAGGEYTIAPHKDTDPLQTGNLGLEIRDLRDFSVKDSSLQIRFINKSASRVKPFLENKIADAWMLQTSSWSNELFGVVGTFEGPGRRTLFFETRHNVYMFDQAAGAPTAQAKLPINRDSSFPGKSFTETIQNVLVNDGTGNQPAVAVNSSMIFGDRVYVMLAKEGTFVRPVSLSVKIPSNCTPLKPVHIRSLNFGAYTLLCKKNAQEAELAFFPLKL